MYALKLDPVTFRILTVTEDKFGGIEDPRVDEFPVHPSNYLYINNEFIYDPLPELEPEPDLIEVLQSEVADLKSQNEMLTECLLEVSEEIYN